MGVGVAIGGEIHVLRTTITLVGKSVPGQHTWTVGIAPTSSWTWPAKVQTEKPAGQETAETRGFRGSGFRSFQEVLLGGFQGLRVLGMEGLETRGFEEYWVYVSFVGCRGFETVEQAG